MRKYFTLIILLFVLGVSQSQVLQLTQNAQISLITCGPGQSQLYEAFGHSAVRISDPINGIDYVYNYGVFDFDQPFFYLNFARGNLNYKLDRGEFVQFFNTYVYFNRSVTEQTLNLNQVEKQKIFDFLEKNNKPENQYYSYDYFYDNCATRIRDVFQSVFKDKLQFPRAFVGSSKATIRELTDKKLIYQPWGDLGIDICLGLPMDVKATPLMHTFLPEYLYKGFKFATLEDENGGIKPFVLKEKAIFLPREQVFESPVLTPEVAFYFLFFVFILLTFVEYKKKAYFKWLDIVWFTIMGLMGVFLLLLWFATNHQAAAGNLNVLWAWPFFLIGVVLLIKNSMHVNRFFKYHFIFMLLIAVLWFWLPQNMHPALLPFTLISSLRSFIIFKNFNSN